MIDDELSKWSELFPRGRFIFYEGDNPEAFVKEIKRKFGFDPSKNESWGEVIDDGKGGSFTSYGFHCPAEHLDAIYGNDKYPMES